MKKILHLTVFLALVAAIAGGALAYANSLTAPVIAYNAELAEKESLLEMYPDAELSEFEAITDSPITVDHPDIHGVYRYGDIVIFNCSVRGYDGGTVFLVAIKSTDGLIDNFKAISNGDTKGIGSQILDAPFRESLLDKPANGDLDTISGATLTSTPVVEAIRECSDLVAEIG